MNILHEYIEKRFYRMNEKFYLLFEDYNICYIEKICDCSKCQERGENEFFINTLDGNYYDCIGYSQLLSDFNNNRILACGKTIKEITDYIKNSIINRKDRLIDLLNSINEYYVHKIGVLSIETEINK